MKAERKFPGVTVTKKAEISIKKGHPWVYAEEITEGAEKLLGQLYADVFSQKGAYLGTGFVSEKSKIRIRILSNNANESFGDAFYERRVKYAVDYRKTVMGEDFSACRLIFGEADGFPGLTVDRFNNILVAQVLSYGTEQVKKTIFESLIKYLRSLGEKIDGLYERNDVAIRELEGLVQYKGWFETELCDHPSLTSTEFYENGIKYTVDFENGQKTGFFLDQKYNRRAVSKIAKDKTVLDCFTHTGSFALNAAIGGAKSVTAVDISESACDMARKNAQVNGLSDKMEFYATDVFDLLTELSEKKNSPYDFIILDPPAFTKSRKTVKNAERGYKEINYKAMKLLPRGGYLATCSCSHFMKDELFVKMLFSAAHDAGVQLKQIEARQQSCDHPILWSVPETDYLKFYIFQIV
ncbi:MAG: class I SAM-dependent rRNA methyltransferase [Clostridia bacterium]|nr:class I SAM-dependent rRNA methyltransferase [Clostridia bacterium]